MNTVELNSINLQSIDIASNNVSSIGKSIKRNKGTTLLPAEYQQVEYIQSSGTQYIDTDFIPNQDSGYDIKFLPLSVSLLFGCRNGYSVKTFCIAIESSGFRFDYGNQNSTYAIDKTNPINAKKRKNLCYVNDVLIKTQNYNDFVCDWNLCLFGANNNGSVVKNTHRIYFITLYDKETKIKSFIPCYRKSDSVIGMYDIINDVFYTNQGTGTFLKGADINEKYSPYIKGHITTSDSTFTFSVDGNNKTVPIDANGDFKLIVKKPITSLSFVGVPQLESLELFAINGVTTFDVDYPTAINYIKCDSTTKNAKNDVYHIRGTAKYKEDLKFFIQYIDNVTSEVSDVVEQVNLINGEFDIAYSGKRIYGLPCPFFGVNNTYVDEYFKTIEFTEPLTEIVNTSGDTSLFPKQSQYRKFIHGFTGTSIKFARGSTCSKINNWYNAFSEIHSLLELDIRDITFENNSQFTTINARSCVTIRLDSVTKPLGTTGVFGSVDSLVNLYVPQNGVQSTNVNLSKAPLSYDSMLRVAGWIKDLTGDTAQTVTFKADTYNALTAEQKAELEGIIVTQKGWELATA